MPALRAATHPAMTYAKNAPPRLNTSAVRRMFCQLTARDASWAPTAIPLSPITSATARAVRAPIQTALQATGQGFQSV
jgi:hypothetical protein